jgi:hypothetical protein
MNKVIATSLALIALFVSNGYAQVAPEKNLSIQASSDAIVLVGQNSSDSQFGPYFGGSVGYGLGYGVTVFVESGYGWTTFESDDQLKLVQIPVLGGVTYNFGQLFDSKIVQPYLGASAGAFTYMLQQDGNTVSELDLEQNTTNFGVEGLVGVNFRINDNVAVEVRGKIDHVFSKQDNPGLESQEWTNVGVGGGVSYSFSL